MRIFIVHSSQFDFKQQLYVPIRKSSLDRKHTILFPHERDNSMRDSQRDIKASDMIIAEVSYPSTGMGVELGWAHIFKKPIVCIYRKGAKISRSLQFITHHIREYDSEKDMISELEDILLRFKYQ